MEVHAICDPERFERNFVRGDWVFSKFGYQFDIYDPSISEVIAAVPLSTRFDVEDTVAAAQEASVAWARRPRSSRVAYVLDAIDWIERELEEIAVLEARDTGAPVRYVREMLSDVLCELRERFRYRQAAYVHDILDQPGVVGVILSWSSPFLVCCRELLPAIADGKTIVLKPSLQAPLSCSAFAEALRAALLPSGVFNLIQGCGIDAGAALAGAQGLSEVWFQGSRRIAQSIGRAARVTGAKARLCLRRPILTTLDEGADLSTAVSDIVHDMVVHAARPGCGGAVVYVHERLMQPLQDALCEALGRVSYGLPVDAATMLGPMISDRARIDRGKAIAALKASSATSVFRAAEPEPRMARMGWFATPEILSLPNCDPAALSEMPLGPTILLRPVAGDFRETTLGLDQNDWCEIRCFGRTKAATQAPATSLFSLR